VVQLFLNSNFSYQRFLNFATREGRFLNFLDRNQNIGGFMLGQLHLSIGSFSKICFPCLHKLKVLFGNGTEHLLESDLLWRERTLIIPFFDKGGGGLDSLDLREQHGVPSLRLLARALELMSLEPVLLEAPLRAVFYCVAYAFRARVEWNELLVEFLVLFHIRGRILNTVLLILPHVL
jgi:hypothetical protein